MNYVILNGTKSTMVKGLLIQSLPPVSKPLMRTQVEEIDGRDGDIITPLGYAAYDKTLRIGLHGNFDIDEVIQYFTSQGTVIFSNEPDKYYYYQVLGQIDFERLIRFRQADVVLHCQPFKYSAIEGSLSLSAKNMLDASAIATNSTAQQYVDFENIVGGIEITVTQSYSGGIFVGAITVSGLTMGQTYTISGVAQSSSFNRAYLYTDALWGNSITSGNVNNGVSFTATTTSVVIGFYATSPTVGDVLTISNIQFEKGSRKTAYIPYNTVQVTNSGNTTARPKITIYGSGTINLSLNGYMIFVIDLSNDAYITIDAALMEAYQDTPATLKNRLVTGDYNNLVLQSGVNYFSWTGTVTEVVVENYSRWI